jgi:transcriptional regulator with XRE-family HTH domain
MVQRSHKNKVLAKRLKEVRLKKNLTQEQVADMLGIEAATLSGYEREYRAPDANTLERLADIYGVSIDYLMGRDDILDRDTPPDEVDLERFIREQSNIRVFGDALSEDVKDDMMLALRTAWEVIKKERASNKKPKG